MPVDGPAIRRTLLVVLHEKQSSAGGSLQQNSILSETSRRFGNLAIDEQQALLTLWYDLFRSGQVAWGYNLSNPDPPFCHLTEQGRRTLEHLSRDPSNPEGYRAYLKQVSTLNPVAEVYVDEAVTTYNANCFRAAAVMIGVAAESVALGLRDAVSAGIQATGRAVPKDLTDFRIKRVLDALQKELEGQAGGMPHDLREDFQAYWPRVHAAGAHRPKRRRSPRERRSRDSGSCSRLPPDVPGTREARDLSSDVGADPLHIGHHVQGRRGREANTTCGER